MPAAQVNIPGLGEFNGLEKDGVAQFKNIQFGHIPGRFKPPQMVTQGLNSVDCTVQGPICPQDELYSDSTLGVDPENVRPIEFKVAEFECLNLMITAPASACTSAAAPAGDSASKVPVVVWIHGGSNCMGTAYRGVNDPFEWVKRGVETAKPFIVVTIQFRVHIFGFLPFKGVGNFGLMDQKLAIEWTHKYISHWGGDASKITVIGQSSGSACAYAQTCVLGRKFKQAAYMSGSVGQFRCKSLAEYSKLSAKICGLLKCTEEDLETLPWERLVWALREAKILVLSPVDDGVFVPPGGFYEPVPKIDSVIFSDCHEDGYFFKDGLPEGALVDAFSSRKDLPYELNNNLDACQMLTDYIFFAGNYNTARKLEQQGATAYTHCFDAVNPINASFGNNHMVELFYLLRAYEIPHEYESLSHQVQDTWIKFVHFESPWPKDKFALVKQTMKILPWEELERHRNLASIDLDLGNVSREMITGW